MREDRSENPISICISEVLDLFSNDSQLDQEQANTFLVTMMGVAQWRASLMEELVQIFERTPDGWLPFIPEDTVEVAEVSDGEELRAYIYGLVRPFLSKEECDHLASVSGSGASQVGSGAGDT